MERLSKWDYDTVVNRKNHIAAILTSSYLYYHRPEMNSICDDVDFDRICADALVKWDTISHMHKHLINKEDLRAGSCFALCEEDYPLIVKHTALRMSTNWVASTILFN